LWGASSPYSFETHASSACKRPSSAVYHFSGSGPRSQVLLQRLVSAWLRARAMPEASTLPTDPENAPKVKSSAHLAHEAMEARNFRRPQISLAKRSGHKNLNFCEATVAENLMVLRQLADRR